MVYPFEIALLMQAWMVILVEEAKLDDLSVRPPDTSVQQPIELHPDGRTTAAAGVVATKVVNRELPPHVVLAFPAQVIEQDESEATTEPVLNASPQ
jgi:hypothetical protein